MVKPLTFAYSTNFHQSTGVSPFSLVMSRHPPGSTTLYFPLTILSDLSYNVSPQISQNHLFAKLAHVRQNVDRPLTRSQKRYKYDDDKHVHGAIFFKIEELSFVFRPPLARATKDSK